MASPELKPTPSTQPTCWAASLGDCSDKISHEHILSKGLFGDEIRVQGMSWCQTAPKKIATDAFTAKILCKKHNEELSNADSAAIGAAQIFREAFELFKIRGESKSPKWGWTLRKFRIDAREFERWLLKTLINITYEGNCLIGSDGVHPGQPSSDLVEIAFGRKFFREQAGFYLMARVGENIPSEDRIQVTTVSPVGEAERIIGARFKLQGFTYFLCLTETGVPPRMGFAVADGSVVSPPADMFYRHAHIKCEVHRRLSHVIDIE